MKKYTTIAGDTWDAVAFKTLGDCILMDKIIKENIKYKDIYIFPSGIELQIPDVAFEEKLSLPPWKVEKEK